MRNIIILTICIVCQSKLLAKDCGFYKEVISYSSKGQIINSSLVAYPNIMSDSHNPLVFPIIKSSPEICVTKKCIVQLHIDSKLISKLSYAYNEKLNYISHKEKKKPIDLSKYKDNFIISFKLFHKDKELCSHSIKAFLRS